MVDDDDYGQITDGWGDNCEDYAQSPGWCGQYNNDVFKSDEMCLACGGGAIAWV